MISMHEREFLKELASRENNQALCISNPPSKPIQSLVERGFCKFSKALCGPLHQATGEVFVMLTDAGKSILKLKGAPNVA